MARQDLFQPLECFYLARLMTSYAPEIHSFDVFDTVITRGFYAPADLFYAVGVQLEADGLYGQDGAAWYALRKRCELAVRPAQRSPSIKSSPVLHRR
jgi:hypothetical protein